MAVYFFYGDEDFNIDLELEKMHSKLNKDFAAMNYQVLDNPDYTNLIRVLRTPPMMFGNMLIVINANKYFFKDENKEIKFEDNELADIENALINNPEVLDIVFVVKFPREDNKKIDTRKKLYKILSKFNTKEFPVFKTYKTSEIVTWINKRAKQKDITIKSDASELLVDLIGNNLRQFDAELDKLKLIAHPQKTITKEMVEEISISNQDLFNLTDYIMKNKKDLALLEFKKLTIKKHPLEILAATQTLLRKWIILKLKASSCSKTELSQLTGIRDFLIQENLQKLKNTSLADLVKLKENLYEAECKLKIAESLDLTSEVECALIR